MSREVRAPDASTLRDYLRVVRRRKWLILQAIVIVPVVAVVLSVRQQHLYASAAQVLLTQLTVQQQITGIADAAPAQQPDRDANTEAAVATVPEIGNRVVRALHLKDRTGNQFLAECSVGAQANANLLTFRCTDRDPVLVSLLTTEWARQYATYRRELDTAEIRGALRGIDRRLAQVAAAGDKRSNEYTDLVNTKERLETAAELRSGRAKLIRTASAGVQVQPKPTRNGMLGLALGVVLGIGLAFLREALDTRVRSAEEVGEHLGLPLLARLPEPPRRLRAEDEIVMLAEPDGIEAEAFRMLRTNVDFANLDRRARTVMVTSAVEAEGKSTTVANLAVAIARAGRHVVLVDLDLRRPFLHRFFKQGQRPGLTHVALGRVDLEEALVPIAIADTAVQASGAAANGNGNGRPRVAGLLELLFSGPLPPNAGEFAASRALTDILDRLRERADIVLIDAPPLLRVNDAMALSARVDALVVVSRLEVARRPMLDELRRVLHSCPATKLGFVATGADQGDGYYGYGGYGYGYGARGYEPSPEREQVP